MINFNTGRMNPEMYAKQFAQQNGMSVSQSQNELRSKFGDPLSQGGAFAVSVFNMIPVQNSQAAALSSNISGGVTEPQKNGGDFLRKMSDFFKGVSAPLKEGDTGFGKQSVTSVLQSPFVQNNKQSQGTHSPVDFNPAGDFGFSSEKMNSPVTNIFMQSNQVRDPDEYAQQYADKHGISLQEAKAELKEKYGNP